MLGPYTQRGVYTRARVTQRSRILALRLTPSMTNHAISTQTTGRPLLFCGVTSTRIKIHTQSFLHYLSSLLTWGLGWVVKRPRGGIYEHLIHF